MGTTPTTAEAILAAADPAGVWVRPGTDPEGERLARRLWRLGLLELAAWEVDRGLHLRLTSTGRAVRGDRRLLADLDAKPPAVRPDGRRAEVQAAVLPGEPGPVTRGLVAMLLVAFVAGGWLAWRAGVPLEDYAMVGRRSPLLDRTAVAVPNLLRGEWWRLLTAWLPHIGLQHFALNAIGLWYVGATCEAMFGRWRTLALIAVSAVGGNLGAVLANPVGGAGASGIVYGLAAAQAAFVFGERAYLTADQRADWRADLTRMFVVMLLMGTGPGFSWGAHLGGAIAGLAGAVFVQLNRRSPFLAVRLLALVAFAALPVAGVLLLPPVAGVPLRGLLPR